MQDSAPHFGKVISEAVAATTKKVFVTVGRLTVTAFLRLPKNACTPKNLLGSRWQCYRDSMVLNHLEHRLHESLCQSRRDVWNMK